MKFGKQLRFVLVKEWKNSYINYKKFKQDIKTFSYSFNQLKNTEISDEQIEEERNKIIKELTHNLYKQLNVATSFYISEYLAIESKILSLSEEIKHFIDSGETDDSTQRSINKRIFKLTLDCYELRNFIEMNRAAGKKLNKKIRKNFGENIHIADYESIDHQMFDCMPATDLLTINLETEYVNSMRNLGTKEDSRPRAQIALEIHEKVEFQIKWKQTTVLTNFQSLDFRKSEISTRKQPINVMPVVFAFSFLLTFLVYQFTPFLSYSAQRCMGLIGFCAILWYIAALPLWLTSISVPFFSVLLKISSDTDYKTVGKTIQQSTISPTIFLTIGGFTIAAALKETEMDKRIAAFVLKKARRNKRLFLLTVSLLNTFIAMWISNVTSTTIVIGLVHSILRQLSTDSNYAKALVFSIAVGGNLGGMTTPLSSPQNAVTIECVTNVAKLYGLDVSLSFTEFFLTCVPYILICSIIAWCLIMIKYPIDIKEVPDLPDVKTDFGWRQVTVSLISVLIIITWIALPFGADKVFSDFGIVGFLPLLFFYGTGILPPTAIRDIPWHILFILMGGNALSKTVSESGLMEWISEKMTSILGGKSLWLSILIISTIVILIDFLLTHTISIMITMPLITAFAATTGHLRLYAMCACMVTTSSQILPVSSFPNTCCVSLEDDAKKEYITISELKKWGLLITSVFFVCVLTIYFGIGYLYGM